MNISTYKKTQDTPALVPLGIAMDYQVNWNMRRIIRDFIQNFYDSIGCEQFSDEFQYEWDTAEKNGMMTVSRRWSWVGFPLPGIMSVMQKKRCLNFFIRRMHCWRKRLSREP